MNRFATVSALAVTFCMLVGSFASAAPARKKTAAKKKATAPAAAVAAAAAAPDPTPKPAAALPATAAPAAGGATTAETSKPPPPVSSPMAELKKSNAALNKLLQRKHAAWSPEAEVQKNEVRKLVGSFLDYGELSRRALGRHWEGLAQKDKDDFVNTLRELVERSYLSQVHGNPNYEIKYDKEDVSGSEAKVTAVLNTVARGKKVAVALEYRLLYKSRWVVYDVVTDEQSLLENYRAEFNKIIIKESFEALLKKMKKKLEAKSE